MDSITPVPKTQVAASIVANNIGIATSPETAVKYGDYSLKNGTAIIPETKLTNWAMLREKSSY